MRLLLACLLLVTSTISAQQFITLKGKITDQNTQTPLESATVYLTTQKDSSVVDYTITEKNGSFVLTTRRNTAPLVLKVSYLGYNNYEQSFNGIQSSQELGTIGLEESSNQLDEVVVKSEAPPVRIKNDTLEFNAASFKVGPDANVEKLLQQLPGVEITPEGEIMVNGKKVNQILVNGKPFFGKDGKIATQNLPAELIEKIQVVNTKTKEEEISGDTAGSDEKTINLTIQEDKNKGYFGKIMGGLGSDERYESSLLLNAFKGERKISVIASSNNINSVGFSMNEIFDNMGGGRNSSLSSFGDGSFGINGMMFGGQTGITQSHLLGINFTDKWLKNWDVASNYFLTNTETFNDNRTSRTNLLPTGTTFTESESRMENWDIGHNVNVDFEIKLDSTSTIYFNPKFSHNRGRNFNLRTQETFDEVNTLLNDSDNRNFSESQNTTHEQFFYWYKALKKKGRGLGIRFDAEGNNRENVNTINSITLFFQGTRPDDIRNQQQVDDVRRNEWGAEIRFNEPINDSLRWTAAIELSEKRSDTKTQTFDFDADSGRFDDLNDLLSNRVQSHTAKWYPNSGFTLRKKKMYFSLRGGAEFIRYQNQSDYLGVITNLNQEYVFPKIGSYFNYQLNQKKGIYGSYNFDFQLPEATQLLPFENLANPLNTVVGNPDLNPTQRHNFYMNFNNYDWQVRSGIYVYAGFSYSRDVIVNSTVFDEDFKAFTTFENVDKNYNTYMGLSWSKTFKKEKRSIRLGAGLDGGFNYSEGLTNAELFESRGYRLEPRFNLNWSIDELITVAPSYRYNFNTTRFKNYLITEADNFVHTAKIEITSYWPSRLVFGNDFTYTYNSNIAPGFQRDFLLWNTSLGMHFFEKRWLAKVKVYDILNQNLGVRRTITPTAVTDSENTVLRRYVMFSLTYRLDKFGGKQEDRNYFMRD